MKIEMITLPSTFNLAKLASEHSNFRRHKMGAVIVRKRPISVGFNVYGKTHPKFSDQISTWSLHAEISAIIHAQCDIEGSTIYVYRQTADGQAALAKPCLNCYAALLEAGIVRAVYTTSEKPYFTELKIR